MIPQLHTLADEAEFLSQLHYEYLENGRNLVLTDAQRRSNQVMAQVMANAWLDLDTIVHPNKPLIPGVQMADPDMPVLSFTLSQLKAIIEMAQTIGITGEPVHIRHCNGHIEAFVLQPDADNGGREFFRDKAIYNQ